MTNAIVRLKGQAMQQQAFQHVLLHGITALSCGIHLTAAPKGVNKLIAPIDCSTHMQDYGIECPSTKSVFSLKTGDILTWWVRLC